MNVWLKKILEFSGLLVLLSLEHAFGLPIAFLMGLFLVTADMSSELRLWSSLGWGIPLGLIYVLPFWQAMVILVGGIFLYEWLSKFMSGEIRRLMVVAGIQTISLWVLTSFSVNWVTVSYHGAILVGTTLLIFLSRLWKYRSGSIGFSQRYRLK